MMGASCVLRLSRVVCVDLLQTVVLLWSEILLRVGNQSPVIAALQVIVDGGNFVRGDIVLHDLRHGFFVLRRQAVDGLLDFRVFRACVLNRLLDGMIHDRLGDKSANRFLTEIHDAGGERQKYDQAANHFSREGTAAFSFSS